MNCHTCTKVWFECKFYVCPVLLLISNDVSNETDILGSWQFNEFDLKGVKLIESHNCIVLYNLSTKENHDLVILRCGQKTDGSFLLVTVCISCSFLLFNLPFLYHFYDIYNNLFKIIVFLFFTNSCNRLFIEYIFIHTLSNDFHSFVLMFSVEFQSLCVHFLEFNMLGTPW